MSKLDASLDGYTASPDPERPTFARPITRDGLSVGTVAYMSPEQARGETLDARSDLFSLGVVLYEMATGQHPFQGATTAIVFDRILNQAPTAPVSLNAQLPPEFEHMLNNALEKDRELHCQSAAELRAELKRLQRKSSGHVTAVPVAPAEPGTSGPAKPPTGGGISGATPATGQSASASAAAVPVRRKSRENRIASCSCWGALVVLLAVAGFAAWRLWPVPRPFTTISVSQITNSATSRGLRFRLTGAFWPK